VVSVQKPALIAEWMSLNDPRAVVAGIFEYIKHYTGLNKIGAGTIGDIIQCG
jgi:hypothetical protein